MNVAEGSMDQVEMEFVLGSPLPFEPKTWEYSPQTVLGFAIVSKDGMLADPAGVMPSSLKVEADQRFFENGLDGVDVVIHGRHSHERKPTARCAAKVEDVAKVGDKLRVEIGCFDGRHELTL